MSATRNRGIRIVSQKKLNILNNELRRDAKTPRWVSHNLVNDDGTKLHLSEDTVKNFLRGDKVAPENFRAIARFFKRSTEWLLSPDPAGLDGLRKAVHYFSGEERYAVLRELQENLEEENNTKVLSLTGRSGVGKTEQILKLIEEDFQKGSDSIFTGGYCFVRIDIGLLQPQIEAFFCDFQKINPGCATPSDDLEGEERIQQWYSLCSLLNTKILLVFDNVRSLDEIANYLPSDMKSTFRVVVTTQNVNLCQKFTNISVKDIDDDDSLAIVSKIFGEKAAHFVVKNETTLQRICTLVGHLPLAVATIMHFIRRLYKVNPNIAKTTVSQLENDRKLADVLTEFSGDMEYVSDGTMGNLQTRLQSEGLRAVYDIIWQKIDEESTLFALTLASFAPGDITTSLLKESYPEYDRTTFDNKLANDLVGLSLVDVNQEEDGILRLHELTRVYLREELHKLPEFESSIQGAIAKSLLENVEMMEDVLPQLQNIILASQTEYFVSEAIHERLVASVPTKVVFLMFYFVKTQYRSWRHIEKLDSFIEMCREYFRREGGIEYIYFLQAEVDLLDIQGNYSTAIKKSKNVLKRARQVFRSFVPNKAAFKSKEVSASSWETIETSSMLLIQISLMLAELYTWEGKDTRTAKDHLEGAEQQIDFLLEHFPSQESQSDNPRLMWEIIHFHKAKIWSYQAEVYKAEGQHKRALSKMRDAEREYTAIYKRSKEDYFNAQKRHEVVDALIFVRSTILLDLVGLNETSRRVSKLLKNLDELVENISLDTILDDTRGQLGKAYSVVGGDYAEKGMLLESLSAYNKALQIYQPAQEKFKDHLVVISDSIRCLREAIRTGKKLTTQKYNISSEIGSN